MRISSDTSSHPVLDELHESLNHVLTVLEQKWEDASLNLRVEPSIHDLRAERCFRLEGPEEMDVGIRFGVYPLGDGTHEVYVEIEGGPTRRFTYNPEKRPLRSEKARLGRTVTAALLDEIEPRLGQVPVPSASSDTVAPPPQLALDEEGRISDLNSPARQLLVDAEGGSFDANFLTRVHGRNLRRVMRDLTRMVKRDLKRARWLLRLQTADDRWRWFHVSVLNRLHSEDAIRLNLYPVGERHDAS